MVGSGMLNQIGKTDKEILKLLSKDARIPLSDIGRRLGISQGAIKHRIDALVENKVIAAFKPIVDMKALGYSYYKVEFNLRSWENLKRLEHWLLNNTTPTHIVRTAGCADLELGIHAKNQAEVDDTLNRIREEFYDDLHSFRFFTYSSVLKDDSLPSA